MSIDLELPSDVAAQLHRQAAHSGLDVSSFALALLREKLQDLEGNGAPAEELSDPDWSARLQAWADSFPPVSHFVDDSRESMYEDRA